MTKPCPADELATSVLLWWGIMFVLPILSAVVYVLANP